eukprot:6194188-Pleurochrysis_carterae.AAC.14
MSVARASSPIVRRGAGAASWRSRRRARRAPVRRGSARPLADAPAQRRRGRSRLPARKCESATSYARQHGAQCAHAGAIQVRTHVR